MTATPTEQARAAIWGVADRSLVSRASIYVASGLLRRAASFLMLPFLLIYLTPEEFSRYGLMLSALTLLVPLLSANAHLAPTRLFFDHESRRGQSDLMVTALLTAGLLCAAGVLLLLLLLELLPFGDPVSQGATDIRLYMGGAILGMVVAEYGFASMKILGDARLFGLTETLHGFSLVGLFLILLRVTSDPIRCLALAHMLAAALPAAIALYHSRGYRASGTFQRRVAVGALRFSAPTVVHVAAFWAIASGGRWIGAAYMPLDTLATYTVLTFAIGIVSMLSRALFEARLPEIGLSFAKGLYPRGAGIINGISALGVGLVLLLYAALMMVLPRLETALPAPYRPTLALLGLAAAASLFDLLYRRGQQMLIALKQPAALAASTVLAALVTAALALWLVRTFQTTGLLVATTVGYALQAASSSLLASRELKRAERSALGAPLETGTRR